MSVRFCAALPARLERAASLSNCGPLAGRQPIAWGGFGATVGAHGR
jgi:hypothetical protein